MDKRYCIQRENNVIGVNFMITSSKLYVPVADLCINDGIKF